MSPKAKTLVKTRRIAAEVVDDLIAGKSPASDGDTGGNGGAATANKGTPSTLLAKVPKLVVEETTLYLVSNSSLIVHRWSEKARNQMLMKQTKQARGAKEAKNPERDVIDSLYWMSPMPNDPTLADLRGAKFGFPSIAFKASAVDACSYVDGITKVEARGAFHIPGDLVEIKSDEPPQMREDMVRIAMGTADIRFRAEFLEWRVALPLEYNPLVLSIEQIANLFTLGGFSVGIGEWRPQKDGQHGRFHVAEPGEVDPSQF
jgi:hypothetical protein